MMLCPVTTAPERTAWAAIGAAVSPAATVTGWSSRATPDSRM